ncbi:MAG: AAA family ATPase [Spongiibacteraceae bacterium]
MYLYHFGMQRLPFGLTPDTAYFCELPGHRAALNVLHVALASGEGFIKITGEVGTGKTLLCRKLLGDLDTLPPEQRALCAYIPNPVLTPHELRIAIAHEIGLSLDANESDALLARRLELKLLEIAQHGRPVILIIDEAQSLPDDSLEALRLLSNLETERHKLLQIVLFGQPELNRRLNSEKFRQLRQRIAFSYHLPQLNIEQMTAYLSHRVQLSGRNDPVPFSNAALFAIALLSRGIPRLGHVLAHKALIAAFGKGLSSAGLREAFAAARDTDDVRIRFMHWQKLLVAGGLGALAVGATAAAILGHAL